MVVLLLAVGGVSGTLLLWGADCTRGLGAEMGGNSLRGGGGRAGPVFLVSLRSVVRRGGGGGGRGCTSRSGPHL